MNKPSVRFVFDRKNVADHSKVKDGKKGLVQMEVKYLRERKFYTTGIKVFCDQWNQERLVINCALSQNYNDILGRMQSDALENIERQLRDGSFSFSVFETIFNRDVKKNTVVGEVDRVMELSESNGMSYSTVMQYSVLGKRIDEYNVQCGRKHRRMDLIENLEYRDIADFDDWLKTEKGLSQAALWNYHSHFKRVINNYILMNNSSMRNPYNLFKTEKPSPCKIKYLTDEELEKIELYEPRTAAEFFARDLFMFMRWTGLSYSDATLLKMDQDVVNEGGRNVIRRDRIKTGKQYTIVLLEPARVIWERYDGDFDRYSCQHVNNLLHEIGKRTVGREISCHMARHSYAVWALHNKVELPRLSKMLGHTNIQTTQIYAKVLQEDVINEFDKLEIAIKKKGRGGIKSRLINRKK